MKLYWAILTLPLVFGLAVDQGVLVADQKGRLNDAAVKRDSFEIFNEVNGLLRQWGNALRPNGFSVTLASVPANTLLYHARTDADEPSSPEWFAFDAEMSYGIYGGRRNTSVYLRTYRTTTTLSPLLYFNGLSAALTFSGTLDTQDLLAPPTNSLDPFGDYARAERLCAWAITRNISGFVRTNAGFELLWCDMESGGLKLVRNVDVTRWADDMDDHSDRRGSDKDGERGGGDGGHRGPPPSPGDHGPFPGPVRGPPGRGFNMFAQYASWEWLRAASHTYDGMGEARVKLHSGWHVTARGIQDSTGLDLTPATRMASLHNTTIDVWRKDVDTMVHMALRERRASSGVDWREQSDALVARYGDRLPQLKELLELAYQTSVSEIPSASVDRAYTQSTNASVPLQQAYRLVSSLIIPFFDHQASRGAQIETCTESVTPERISDGESGTTTSYERKLWTAITHVHRSICTVIMDVHSELAELRSHKSLLTSSQATRLLAGASLVEQLIARLDWSVWVRCPDICTWGQVCYIPIWPLFGFGAQNRTRWPMPGSGRPEPQCAGGISGSA